MIRSNGHAMRKCFVGGLMLILLHPGTVFGETICVDGRRGLDATEGTEQRPAKTLARAAAMVNAGREAGPTTIKVRPGIYALDQAAVLDAGRAYSREKRLTIESSINPDVPACWK